MTQEILPQLRRARMTINYNLIGRSDDEIQAQYKSDASQLSVEELLYSTTLTENVAEQEGIFKKTAQLYPNDYRAYNNLATIAYANGKYNDAKNYLQQALKANSNAAEPNVNLGLIFLINNDLTSAQKYLAKGAGSQALGEALGNMYLKQGNYAQAVKSFGNAKSNSAALAQILTKDYMKAAETLAAVQKKDAMTSYLKAIVAARTNNNNIAVDNLRDAIAKDASLAAYAAKDLEFLKLQNDATFKVLTNK